MKKKDIRELHTVLVENYMLDKETGLPINCGFVLYTAPTTPAMAKSLAEQVKMVNKSYRIMTGDGQGRIVDQWLRKGFVPDDGRTIETVCKQCGLLGVHKMDCTQEYKEREGK